MNILVILCFVIWIYFISVLHRGNLNYFKFIWGSVGLFIFMMIFFQPIASEILTELVSSSAGIVGRFTGLYESYHEYGVIFIANKDSSISLYIDYECSGIIEMMAFVSMVAFFQVYDLGQRVIISILGCIGIFLANVVRIFIICLIIFLFGNNSYYFAHTFVGRIVFYGLSVVLYYFVFTKAQIIKQKVGGFSYAENNDVSVK